MRCPRFALVLVLASGGAGAMPLVAQGPSPAVQASTYDKIFGFDRALGDRSKLKVLLVYDTAASKPLVTELEQAFGAAGIAAEPVAVAAAAGRLQSSTVAYLLPGVATADLLRAAVRSHSLTISGDASLPEQGRAAVGLTTKGEKTEIVVNLERVMAEGHSFSAQLLKFARVIRGGGGDDAGAAAAGGGGNETDSGPVLSHVNRPPYPVLARKLQAQGDVLMRLSVDETGRVTSAELIKGVGRGGIDEAALAAARTARFKPATKNGQPVAGTYQLTMPFRL